MSLPPFVTVNLYLSTAVGCHAGKFNVADCHIISSYESVGSAAGSSWTEITHLAWLVNLVLSIIEDQRGLGSSCTRRHDASAEEGAVLLDHSNWFPGFPLNEVIFVALCETGKGRRDETV